MPFPGRLPYPGNPLKKTTAGIIRAWREELAALRRRLGEIRAEAGADRPVSEAEGLRRRLETISAQLAEVELLAGEPEDWRREVPEVRLGSLVQLVFEDGGERSCLLVGLAGPEAGETAITPASPLGAAILGRSVGETVSYLAGNREYRVTIRRCLVPGESSPANKDGAAALVGRDEEEEARRVAMAVQDLLTQGVPPDAVAVAWRLPHQGGPFELACAKGGLRYRLPGGESFFASPEVRGALAALRLLADPSDAAACAEFSRFCGAAGIPDRYLAGYAPRRLDLAPAQALAGLADALRGERPELFRSGPGRFWPILQAIAAPYRRLRSFLAEIQELASPAVLARRDGIVLTPLDRLDGRECEVLFVTGAVEGALPLPGADGAEEYNLLRRATAGARHVVVSWSTTAGGQPARPSPFAAGLMRDGT